MIKPTELKIGNLVCERNNHRLFEVAAVDQYGAALKYWSCGQTECVRFNRLIPIPITEELLIAKGFVIFEWPSKKLQYKHYTDGRIILRLHSMGVSCFTNSECDFDGYNFICQVSYYHQLQNLYQLLFSEGLK